MSNQKLSIKFINPHVYQSKKKVNNENSRLSLHTFGV